MKRVLLLCVAMMMLAAPARAEEAKTAAVDRMKVSDAIFEAFQQRYPGEIIMPVHIHEEGDWMSAVRYREDDQSEAGFAGAVCDMPSAEIITWADLFEDGDAAASLIESIAAEALYANAYAERAEVTPVPRDSFAVRDGQLFLYYPAEQFSYFSGRSGALALYAYELRGVLRPGLPLTEGDAEQAPNALAQALSAGALPGALEDWPLGRSMQEADGMLGLVDVPDLRDGYAVWRFEAPEMRGAAFLSAQDSESVQTAVIEGIYAERMDFSGLATGISTLDACVQTLGEPAERGAAGEDSPYALMPAGESLRWADAGHSLTLHFVDGLLHSVTLLKEM